MVNTEPLYFQAIQEQLATLGIELTEAEYTKNMAYGADPWMLARQAGCDEYAVDRIRNARDERYQQLLGSKPIQITHAAATVAELAEQYQLAIVTTSRDEDFDLIHGLGNGPKHSSPLNMVQHMDFVLKRSDYKNSKPDPEPYLLALQRFDIPASNALVIEDSERGLRAAVAAGIDCAAIYHPFTASQDFSNATYRFADLQALKKFLLPRESL